MQSYLDCPVPQPGCELEFCPDSSLQPVHYLRPKLAETGGAEYIYRAAIAAAEAEAAAGLKGWTVAALCRSMSLENILLMLSGRAAGHTRASPQMWSTLLVLSGYFFCAGWACSCTALVAVTKRGCPEAYPSIKGPSM